MDPVPITDEERAAAQPNAGLIRGFAALPHPAHSDHAHREGEDFAEGKHTTDEQYAEQTIPDQDDA